MGPTGASRMPALEPTPGLALELALPLTPAFAAAAYGGASCDERRSWLMPFAWPSSAMASSELRSSLYCKVGKE